VIRRLFTALSALSLALCVAVVILWVRSYWIDEALVWGEPHVPPPTTWHMRAVSSTHGRVAVFVYQDQQAALSSPVQAAEWVRMEAYLDPVIGREYQRPATIPVPADQFLGFGYDSEGGGMEVRLRDGTRYATRSESTIIGFPHWCLAALFAAMPVQRLWIGRRLVRMRQRLATGQCAACGYDIRATPDRCPECGAVPAAKGAA
jgi:hypothetical protein